MIDHFWLGTLYTKKSAKAAPSESIITSITAGFRPGTNDWWNSSLAEYKVAKIQAISICQGIIFLPLPFNPRKYAVDNNPYPSAWPPFLTTKSSIPKLGISLDGMEEKPKMTTINRRAGPHNCRNNFDFAIWKLYCTSSWSNPIRHSMLTSWSNLRSNIWESYGH